MIEAEDALIAKIGVKVCIAAKRVLVDSGMFPRIGVGAATLWMAFWPVIENLIMAFTLKVLPVIEILFVPS